MIEVSLIDKTRKPSATLQQIFEKEKTVFQVSMNTYTQKCSISWIGKTIIMFLKQPLGKLCQGFMAEKFFSELLLLM